MLETTNENFYEGRTSNTSMCLLILFDAAVWAGNRGLKAKREGKKKKHLLPSAVEYH